MKRLLDTNTCIQILNRRIPQLREQMRQSAGDEIVRCDIVKAELFYGVEKCARGERIRATLEEFLSWFVSLPFDGAAARVYGRIKTELGRAGRLIGPNDLMIASIALANDLTLVTHNTSEFGRGNGLLMEDWQTP